MSRERNAYIYKDKPWKSDKLPRATEIWGGGANAIYFPEGLEHREVEDTEMEPRRGYVDETCGWVKYRSERGKVEWTGRFREQWRPRLYKMPIQDREKLGIRLGAVYYDKITDPQGQTQCNYFIGGATGQG